MANIRFVAKNFMKTGVVSASSNATGSTPSYLKDFLVGRMTRSVTASNSAYVRWTVALSQPETVTAWAIIAPNFTQNATISLAMSNTSNFGVLLVNTTFSYSSVTQPRSPILYGFLQTPVLVRYVQWDIFDFSNPDQFIEAGELAIGQHVEVEWNATFPWQESHYGQNVLQRSEAGAGWSFHWQMRREIQLAFGIMNDNTRRQLEDVVQSVRGSHEPFLLHRNADKVDEEIRWGRLESRVNILQVTGNIHSVDGLVFVEEPMPIRL